MQYDTSMPAAVQAAMVPPAPKSTSSGWATTTSARSTSSSRSAGRSHGGREAVGSLVPDVIVLLPRVAPPPTATILPAPADDGSAGRRVAGA